MTSQDKPDERLFVAIYRCRTLLVCAPSSYEAQCKAAAQFKAKRRFEVTVYLSDAPVNAASL